MRLGDIRRLNAASPVAVILRSGPLYWWRPKYGISVTGGKVVSWTDYVSQKTLTSTGADIPYNTSDALFGGAPTLQFTRSGGKNATLTGTTVPLATNNTMMIVLSKTATMSGTYNSAFIIGDASGSNALYANLQASNKVGTYNGAEIIGPAALTLNAAQCLTSISTGPANVRIRLDGTEVTRTNGTTYNNDRPNVVIGSFASSVTYASLEAKVVSALYWPKALSASELTSVAAAIKSMYGVTV